LDCDPEDINEMIRNGESCRGALFLDYGVAGNILSRAGLDALIETATTNSDVTHVFIPRRNRLARPNDPLDGIKLETLLRAAGVTIVFMDRVCKPLKKGKRDNIAEIIGAVIDYDRSAEDRRELAQKIIYAQLRLAKAGFSTGGRPPFGYRRWLASESGTPVRELAEGEYVKMQGHHVVWLPSNDEQEWKTIRRILKLLETTPASRVAAILAKLYLRPTICVAVQTTAYGIVQAVSGANRLSTISREIHCLLLSSSTAGVQWAIN